MLGMWRMVGRTVVGGGKVTARKVGEQKRFLNLHEYQSKGLMDKFKVNTQPWRLARTADAARVAAAELQEENGGKDLVVKAQVHAGGRGKGVFDTGFKGGVHLCKEPAEAGRLAGEMISHRLITKQTGKDGVPVNSVMVLESLDFSGESYFAILMDREHNGPVMVGSPDGGMDIEEVAAKTPERVFTQPIDISQGPQREQTKDLARKMGFDEDLLDQAAQQLERLYELFITSDATQVEINPLVQTSDKKVYCVDAKINFDDNAAFRQKDIFEMHDPSEDDPREVAAGKADLNYIGLDGNIGCLVNGAGLAMATMDIIKHYGGEPANFCDLGGGATEERVKAAFDIITSDTSVKAILVNIFGGIVRCDVIARGIIGATKSLDLKVPLVVRLAGTNAEIANDLLAESGLKIHTAKSMSDAASIVTGLIKN
eukprot:CAMPEP_0119152344 /NCGR_PEP_ID=MMETSP1310-20130426/47668_1 /TAXON_ID=464262 /ORGANISM="Genus nov. species nov., Strain RCC2339" /LENGTH=427 /DNA_ID=CAMNT_0007144697 /DNA_START=119 /DNA_END=1402 /DNA_ORIENTATION=+